MPFAPNPKLVTQLASRFPKRPTVGSQVDLAKGPIYPGNTGAADQVTINKPPPGAGIGGGPMIHPPPNIGGIGGPSMGGVTPLPQRRDFGMRNSMPGSVGQFTTQPAPMPTRTGGVGEFTNQPAPMPTKMAKGGQAKAYAKGGSIDGCAKRGKTKGRIV